MIRLSLFILLACLPVPARTWTNINGKTIEAEFLSVNNSEVKVRHKDDRRVVSIPLTKLSPEDKAWIIEQNRVEPEAPKLPKAVAPLVAEQGTLIFEDDFNREDPDDTEDLGEHWVTNSAKRAQGAKQNDLADGTLVMTISPKADHAISTRHEEEKPYQDVVVSLKMMIPADGALKFAYNDRQDKSVWAGHINGVTIKPDKLTIDDERTGRFNMKFRENKKSPEAKAAMKSSAKSFDLDLDPDEWHEIVTHHQGETLTVYIDGKEVGQHTSPGFGHETKRDFVFAVPKKATVDDLKIWAIAE